MPKVQGIVREILIVEKQVEVEVSEDQDPESVIRQEANKILAIDPNSGWELIESEGQNVKIVNNTYRGFTICDVGQHYLITEGDDPDYIQEPFPTVEAAKHAIDRYLDLGIQFHVGG